MGLDVVLAASYFAGCAGILAHVADVLTCYSARPELDQLFHTPGDILDFRKASVMMAEKTTWELAAGHVLALIFIPSGFAGTCLLYKVLKPQYRWLRWPLVLLLFAFYVAGALMRIAPLLLWASLQVPLHGDMLYQRASLQTSSRSLRLFAVLWGRLPCFQARCTEIHNMCMFMVVIRYLDPQLLNFKH